MVIAIDGPAGSGKSTIAKLIAEKTGALFLNSGSFYRGITLAWLRSTVTPGQEYLNCNDRVHYRKVEEVEEEENRVKIPRNLFDFFDFAVKNSAEALVKLAAGLTIDYVDARLHINGKDVEDLLHSDAVDAWVSQVSAVPAVRAIVNAHLIKIAEKRNVVCEGRDMCTVVFPNAEYQFYLDAGIEVQAMRRFKQGVSGLSLEEIRAAIQARDDADKKKAVGALKIAKNAAYIDTTHLTIIEVCDTILGKITLDE